MNKFRNKLVAAAALAILAVIGSFMGGPRPVAAAGGPNVTIDGPLPLPVNDAPSQPFNVSALCTLVGGGAAELSCTAYRRASVLLSSTSRLSQPYQLGTK